MSGNNRSKKLILYIFIPVFLALNGYAISLLTFRETSFTTLIATEDIGSQILIDSHSSGNVRGTFTAKYDNLGTFSPRLVIAQTDTDKFLDFKIRPLGSKIWSYEHVYKFNNPLDYDYYPIGFPIFTGSKGKVYEFEINFSKQNTTDAIKLNSLKPQFMTKYRVDKAEIFQSQISEFQFLKTKISNSFIDEKYFEYLILCLLPLFIYYSLVLFIRSGLVKYYVIIILILLVTAIVDISIRYFGYLAILYYLLFSIFILSLRFGISGNVAFGIALLFLLTSGGYIFFKNLKIAEQMVIWTYYFMVEGILLTIWDLIKNKPGISWISNYFSKLRTVQSDDKIKSKFIN
jgi:hypothetical protein